MNVTNNSDIQSGTSTVYLNKEGQGTNLFFTDNFDEQYYFLMRDREVIASGVMKGYKEGSANNYRFNFENFIKINNQDMPTDTSADAYGSYRFTGDNSCTLYLYLSGVDRLESNIFNGVLVVQPDGKITLGAGKTYANIVATDKVYVTFKDTIDNTLYWIEDSNPIAGQYTPITIYNTAQINITTKKGNSTIRSFVQTISTTGYGVLMYKVHEEATSIEITFRNGITGSVTKQVDKTCSTPYYFWNYTGAYDVIRLEGVSNKLIDTEKQYFNLNGTQIPLKITTQEKIVHNTGLALSQEQIYSLIKAPQVDRVEVGPIHNLYNIDLESFAGYNGTKLSDKNMELIFSKPRKTRRLTNKNITFFD